MAGARLLGARFSRRMQQGATDCLTLPPPTRNVEAPPYTALVKAAPAPRKHPAKERSNNADRAPAQRQGERGSRERRSGEGSESALAKLKSIERDRQKNTPADEGGDRD